MGGRGTRIALAEDDVLLREGIASLLEGAGYDVVCQAGDAVELVASVRDHLPEIAIIDIRMPPTCTTEGLDAARVIRESSPETGILLLSAHIEVDHALELLATGHRVGYLLKNRVTSVTGFMGAIERIIAGDSVVDPVLVQELFAARRREDPLELLTPREREVLALMAEGRSNAGIAHQLWITEGTVEKHVRSIMSRMRLPEAEGDHRRVLAVITFLEAR
jgi:DNA-binding NarL/FixJ family response regulator